MNELREDVMVGFNIESLHHQHRVLGKRFACLQ
jgi:hypothetical protein